MRKGEKKRKQIFGLVIALVAVLLGGVLFMGAVSGWFADEKAVLDAEYYCADECDGEFMELSIDNYEKLIKEKKTFVVFVDQGGCNTADRLRGFVKDWAVAKGVKVYRMMFGDVKESSLYDVVKYYPSMVVVTKGRVLAWLKADADEDVEKYNNYDDFTAWLEKKILLTSTTSLW